MLLNWRFKITNSNNHISNYELAELPIALPSISDRKEIEKLVSLIKNNNDQENVYKLNTKVFELYGLNKEEVDYVLGKHQKLIGSISKPQKKVYSPMVYNHTTYSLSKNDLRMVKSVPPGETGKIFLSIYRRKDSSKSEYQEEELLYMDAFLLRSRAIQ